jgi:protein-S-isoprenylcysteine O-methyltransferase Ste14
LVVYPLELLTPITIAYPLAIIVVALDLLSRDRSSVQRKEDDRGSTIFMTASYAGAFVLLPVFSSITLLRTTDEIVGWIGLAIMLVGVGIRLWARVTLGRYYSLKLETREKQPVVQEGPYARVRHPGYLGYLLMWVGLTIASQSALAVIVIIPLMSAAYGYRIKNEEEMLVSTSGAVYEQYKKRTKRLIPFVY